MQKILKFTFFDYLSFFAKFLLKKNPFRKKSFQKIEMISLKKKNYSLIKKGLTKMANEPAVQNLPPVPVENDNGVEQPAIDWLSYRLSDVSKEEHRLQMQNYRQETSFRTGLRAIVIAADGKLRDQVHIQNTPAYQQLRREVDSLNFLLNEGFSRDKFKDDYPLYNKVGEIINNNVKKKQFGKPLLKKHGKLKKPLLKI